MVYPIFTLFASLDGEALSKKGKNFSWRSKVFPLSIDPHEEEEKTRALDKREYLIIIRDNFVNSAEKHTL